MRLILVATGIGLIIGLFGTPLLIRFLRRHGYAQAIRDASEGYPAHDSKKGTPSMGGLILVLGAILGYVAGHVYTWQGPTASGLCVLFLMTGLGAVGFADDYIKIFKQRSTGLRARTKLIGQAVVSLIFGLLVLRYPDNHGLTPASHAISFVRDSPWVMPVAVFLVWVYLMVAATSNGVNLTDGLDGLATGASVMVFGAYVVIGVWQFRNACVGGPAPQCYSVRDPLDLAVLAAAMVGACFGFLWWNASPAQIFMGDTGSLALGGAMAGLAITTRTDVLLLLLAGLFVVITMSVILQVASFKLTRKRIFLMAPLQHHFELRGWGEVTIVIRFWIIAGLCVGLGLGVFYAEWISGGPL
ncbi:MAG TPA: phospho-N-acetylmuramoyl-pentapeptide-transferase [Actinomycetes bacterium]